MCIFVLSPSITFPFHDEWNLRSAGKFASRSVFFSSIALANFLYLVCIIVGFLFPSTLAQKGQGLTHTEVEKLTELLYSRGCRSPQVLMFMADKLREDCEKADASDDIGEKVRLCSEVS